MLFRIRYGKLEDRKIIFRPRWPAFGDDTTKQATLLA